MRRNQSLHFALEYDFAMVSKYIHAAITSHRCAKWITFVTNSRSYSTCLICDMNMPICGQYMILINYINVHFFDFITQIGWHSHPIETHLDYRYRRSKNEINDLFKLCSAIGNCMRLNIRRINRQKIFFHQKYINHVLGMCVQKWTLTRTNERKKKEFIFSPRNRKNYEHKLGRRKSVNISIII